MFNYICEAAQKLDKYIIRYGKRPFKIILSFTFWFLGSLLTSFSLPRFPKNDNVCRIAFKLYGGVGDILIALNYIQNFSQFLDCSHEIDLYIPKKRGLLNITRVLCKNQNFIKDIFSAFMVGRNYDIVVTIVRFPRIEYYNKRKLSAISTKLDNWYKTVEDFRCNNVLFYRHGTPGDFLGTQYILLQEQNRLSQADIGGLIGVQSIFQPQIPEDFETVKKKFSLQEKFITLQRGVGGGDRNVSTKLWPMKSYEKFVKLFKERFPEIQIVQLGTNRNIPIQGVDLDLRGKTTFEEMIVLINKSRCHLDGECGMVHLRHFLQAGASVVLFGPTDERFFGYPENANLRSKVCSGGCEWLTGSYTRLCPRGFKDNECLQQLTPEKVLDEFIKKMLL